MNNSFLPGYVVGAVLAVGSFFSVPASAQDLFRQLAQQQLQQWQQQQQPQRRQQNPYPNPYPQRAPLQTVPYSGDGQLRPNPQRPAQQQAQQQQQQQRPQSQSPSSKAGESPAPARIVRNGIAIPQPDRFEGVPVAQSALNQPTRSAMEVGRMLRLAKVAANPAFLDDPAVALKYVIAFLPWDYANEFVVCGTARCSDSNPEGQRWKGNEIEQKHSHRAFVEKYRDRLIAEAPKLPLDVYVTMSKNLGEYSMQNEAFTLYTNVNNGKLDIAPQFCAPNLGVPPTVALKLAPGDAEKLIKRLEVVSPVGTKRPYFFVYRMRVNALDTQNFANISACRDLSAEVLETRMHSGKGMSDFVMDIPVDLPAGAPAVAFNANASSSRSSSSMGGAGDAQLKAQPMSQAAESTAMPKMAPAGRLEATPGFDVGASPTFDVVGVRIGAKMADAERAIRKHMDVDIVYKFETEAPALGYPEGLAYISLKNKEMIRVFTGKSSPGVVSAIDRWVSIEGADQNDMQKQLAAKYSGHKTMDAAMNASHCVSLSSSQRVKMKVDLVSGSLPSDDEGRKFLKTVNPYQVRPVVTKVKDGNANCKALASWKMQPSDAGPMLHLMVYDHSKATLDAVEPARTIKF